jgi:hypothetical protein
VSVKPRPTQSRWKETIDQPTGIGNKGPAVVFGNPIGIFAKFEGLVFGIRSHRDIEDFRGGLPNATDQCVNAVLASAKSGAGIGRERTY